MIRYEFDRWISGKNPDDQGMPSTVLSGDEEICWCEECRIAWYSRLGCNFHQVPTWFKPVIPVSEWMKNQYIFADMCRAIEPAE